LPQILGNGKDLAQLAFLGKVPLVLLATLLFVRPLATIACLGSGAPGGLFTPTLTIGAMLGGALGYGWSLFCPGVPLGVFAFVGAAAMLAATTQGPISSVILMIELTGYEYSSIVPLLLAVVTATLVARSFEIRSVYDARLTDEQILTRQRAREKMIA
jgi:H+/Cl- antiporter ClcA